MCLHALLLNLLRRTSALTSSSCDCLFFWFFGFRKDLSNSGKVLFGAHYAFVIDNGVSSPAEGPQAWMSPRPTRGIRDVVNGLCFLVILDFAINNRRGREAYGIGKKVLVLRRVIVRN